MPPPTLCLFYLIFLLSPLPLSLSSPPTPATVCIVGSGIGGASLSHFLRTYSRPPSQIGTIHVFERNEVVGGRMNTVNLSGETFEAGASILHPKNYHTLNFTQSLNLTPTTKKEDNDDFMSLGIWSGDGFVFKTLSADNWKVPILRNIVDKINSLRLLFRYGISLLRMNTIVENTVNNFLKYYESHEFRPIFGTVEEMLKWSGLYNLTSRTLEEELLEAGLSPLLIEELVTVITRINYGQSVKISGLGGTVSLAGSTAGLWAVEGGNKQIPAGLIQNSDVAMHLNEEIASISRVEGSYELNSVAGNSYACDVAVVAASLDELNIQFSPPVSIPKRKMHHTHTTFVRGLLNPVSTHACSCHLLPVLYFGLIDCVTIPIPHRNLGHNLLLMMKNVEDVAQSKSSLCIEAEHGREASNNLEDSVPKRSFSQYLDDEQGRQVSRSDKGISKSQRLPEQNHLTVPFSKLSFGDRRKLLEIVTCQVRLEVPNSADSPLFPCLREDEVRFKREITHLSERRALLIKLHKFERERLSCTDSHETPSLPAQLDLSEIKKILDRSSGFRNSLSGDDTRRQCARRRTLRECLRNSIKQMLRRSNSVNGVRGLETNGSSSTESKHAQLHEFLHSGDTVGLTLNASTMKLSSYRAWPNMHDSRFALYKLPIRAPSAGQEYAGLWGGTFGWPPGRPSEDKPGKALFFLALSYHDELPGKRLLIATKILEGTHYVLHPNGSAMFVVNFDEPSVDPFPWTTGADALPVNVKCAFTGEGIANGYGFRYPGSKPGSLFELQDETLAFLWKESGAVLTLRRLNLQELLKKGEQVPALPPIANFSYLTKSYSNVFAGFANMATSLSSPRGIQS